MAREPTHSMIVFGDDGSAGADLAWAWLNCQRWPGWTVQALTAVLPELGKPPSAEAGVPHPWEPPSPRVVFAESGIGSLEHLTVVADPRIALSRPADLLVLGARGAGLAKALRLGSAAEWLLADPPAPLVIVKNARPVRRVLVAIDGSTHAEAACVAFARLPWAATTMVRILTIDDGRVDHTRAVSVASALLDGRVASTSATLATGDPTEAILRELGETSADLVVLGTRGLTGWARLRVGSTASSVARRCAATVLVAHKPESDVR